jgi:hypothetical protein
MGLPHVNYLAVLVSGVAIFLLGGLWYSPALFAKKWVALLGKSEAEMKAGTGPMPVMLLMAFLCGLVSAFALAVVMHHFSDVTVVRGAMIGVICWIGFAGATSYANALFSMKPRALWLIDSGFNLVSFVIAGVILALWK